MSTKRLLVLLIAAMFILPSSLAFSQERLPDDNTITTYHPAPRYRESESHPLRIVAYVLHPIGWLAREVVFRPLSYFASSTETTRSIMGYREPYDFRQPSCLSGGDSIPDCRSVVPYNYKTIPSAATNGVEGDEGTAGSLAGSEQAIYFPDINFDFNARRLNELGKSKARVIAVMLKRDATLKVVLEGHTDDVGTDKYNLKLGMDRADALRQELVSQGVSPERLSTVTFGKSQPLFAEKTNWARAANRRVEVHVDEEEKGAHAAPVAIVPGEQG